MFCIDKLQKNISLAPCTTFKIGGTAKYFCEARNSEDIIAAIKMARKENLPFFILGGGSNILISDKGFDGLVIKVKSQKSKVKSNLIYSDAGVLLNKLVAESVKRGLTGLEWAAGIPGIVGGAVRGNAGAFGVSMADIVKEVKTLIIGTSQVQIIENKDCEFKYRDSIFKHNKNLIILSVELEFEKGDRETSKKIIKQHLLYRKKHQPSLPSAGCIFKNTPEHSAGHLIEQCGLNGKKIGKAQIFEKHGNFIVNLGEAKANDVKKLIDLCKEKVKERFGVDLEEEIEYLGEF